MTNPIFHRKKGFTLVEVMIIVVIVGIMAVFAVPNYQRAVNRSRERNLLNNLILMSSAQISYRSRTGTYWPGNGVVIPEEIVSINANLRLAVVQYDNMFYQCHGAAGVGVDKFYCYGTWAPDGVTPVFQVRIEDGTIDGTNPCCEVALGACLITQFDCAGTPLQ